MQAARLSLLLLSLVNMPGTTAAPREVAPIELSALGESSALASTYRLPIVPVAAPPPRALVGEGAQSAATALAAECPFEVRAIVVAETEEDSFALLARADETKLLRLGESVSLHGAPWKLAELEEDSLVLRAQGSRVRCGLRR